MFPSKDQPNQPDYAGLQADRSNEAPEVVSESRYSVPLARHSSERKPEYYAPQSAPTYPIQAEKQAAPADRNEPPSYPGHTAEIEAEASSKRDKRLCGLRRRTCIWLVAVVAVAIVIAILLGAILGTLPNSGSNSNSKSNTASDS